MKLTEKSEFPNIPNRMEQNKIRIGVQTYPGRKKPQDTINAESRRSVINNRFHMLKYLLPLLALAALPVQAQNLSGRIVGPDSQPVPYVNIGLTDRPAGTLSGQDGSFSFRADKLTGKETLRISCIGYEPQEYALADIDLQQPFDVRLKETEAQTVDTTVRPAPRNRYTFGRDIGSNRFSAAFRRGQEGGEMGVKCKLGDLWGHLQRAHLNLAGCRGVDTLHMRINVYAMRGDRIGRNLLSEPVYFSIPASEADKTATIDLRPYDIHVKGDFLISVENLTRLPSGAKYWVRARLLARTYTRYASQAPWKIRKAGVGLSVDVLTE